MKYSLLGTTALAGVALAGLGTATPAQAQSPALEVIVGGFVGFEVNGASEDALDGDLEEGSDRGYEFSTDSELHIRVQGETEGGTLYGAKIEFEADQGTDNNVDEAGLFFSGAYGRVELGADDGVEDNMSLGAHTIAAGTGGLDGEADFIMGTNTFVFDTDDAVKATYYTPRIAGFQVGVSFTPDTGDDGDNENLSGSRSGDNENSVGVGANYTGEFGPAELGLAAVGHYAKGEENAGSAGSDRAETIRSYALGGTLGFGDLQFAGSWGQNLRANELDFITAGVAYDFGFVNTSFNYNWVDPAGEDIELSGGQLSDGSTRHIFVFSADTGLAPGLSLAGDIAYTDAEENFVSGIGRVQVEF
ncbi:porin [Marinivivus vitaminiproducens]|uniref:porin n=1 Tax=Marinivivus vitaminiproducens TaxID=3035935 RepID=UPI002797EDBA|nr:porin [Geminicoccaceae bacterium SCSIO 64248]